MNRPHRNAIATPRQERVQIRLPVQYGLKELDREGSAQDVSEGGLYIRTNRVYRVGTRFRLRIQLPDTAVLQIGEVSWAIQVPDHLKEILMHGMGVQFVGATGEWAERFTAWKRNLLEAAGCA